MTKTNKPYKLRVGQFFTGSQQERKTGSNQEWVFTNGLSSDLLRGWRFQVLEAAGLPPPRKAEVRTDCLSFLGQNFFWCRLPWENSFFEGTHWAQEPSQGRSQKGESSDATLLCYSCPFNPAGSQGMAWPGSRVAAGGGTWGHTGGLGCILEMRKPRDREVRSISTVQQSGCLEAGVRGRRCNSRVLVSLGYRISHRRSPSLCICYNNGKETECGRKHFSPGQLRRCPVKARNRASTKEQWTRGNSTSGRIPALEMNVAINRGKGACGTHIPLQWLEHIANKVTKDASFSVLPGRRKGRDRWMPSVALRGSGWPGLSGPWRDSLSSNGPDLDLGWATLGRYRTHMTLVGSHLGSACDDLGSSYIYDSLNRFEAPQQKSCNCTQY